MLCLTTSTCIVSAGQHQHQHQYQRPGNEEVNMLWYLKRKSAYGMGSKFLKAAMGG